MWRAAFALALAGVLAGCGGSIPPPKRRVIESSVEDWNFRRYQRVVDVEVWVPDNKASAHTASYLREGAERRGRVGQGDVVNAFVTEYEKPGGVLRAVVKFARRLAAEGGYVVDENSLGGQRVITVVGHGEAWALWGAKRFVVKVGGRGLDEVPGNLVEAYGKAYPSSLPSGLLQGPLPPGPDEKKPKQEEYDPDSPDPDWEHKRKKRRK